MAKNNSSKNYAPVAGEWWTYVGPGDGTLSRHKVVCAQNGEVVTWSLGFRLNGSGDSWFGPENEFLRVFRPV